jgi:hypothetical protein
MGLYFKNQEVEILLDGNIYEVTVGSPLAVNEAKKSHNEAEGATSKANDQANQQK